MAGVGSALWRLRTHRKWVHLSSDGHSIYTLCVGLDRVFCGIILGGGGHHVRLSALHVSCALLIACAD
jgi:hypothetical protein